MNRNEQAEVVRYIGISSISSNEPDLTKQVNIPNLPEFTYDYILTLPHVNFSERMLLPSEQGLYFVCLHNANLEKPIYIGSSLNLWQRFRNHDKLLAMGFLEALELDIGITYLLLPSWSRVDIEALEFSVIKKFNPRMNKVGKGLANTIEATRATYKPFKICHEVSDEAKKTAALKIDKPLEALNVRHLKDIGKELAIKFVHNTSKKEMCDVIKDVFGAFYDESRLKGYTLQIEQIVNKPRTRTFVSRETVVEVFEFWKAEKSPEENLCIRQLKRIAMSLKIYRYSNLTKEQLIERINDQIAKIEDNF